MLIVLRWQAEVKRPFRRRQDDAQGRWFGWPALSLLHPNQSSGKASTALTHLSIGDSAPATVASIKQQMCFYNALENIVGINNGRIIRIRSLVVCAVVSSSTT